MPPPVTIRERLCRMFGCTYPEPEPETFPELTALLAAVDELANALKGFDDGQSGNRRRA
jgi:hypothetical protein